MHCTCCDKTLNDFETSIKHKDEGHYLDICVKCLDGLGIPYIGNMSLAKDSVESFEEESELVFTNIDLEDEEYE
jgi:hypothetical protein